MKKGIIFILVLMFAVSWAFAEKAAPIQYDPANYPTPRQGGDTVANATVIGSLPYNDIGTTSGYTDDYDEVCPYTGSTSPDVVYSFTPSGDVTNVWMSLCGAATDYDTKLYIYENSVTPGAPYACNDDECPGYLSEFNQVNTPGFMFTGGNTYYIVVDGYGGGSGTYQLDITGDASTIAYTIELTDDFGDGWNGGYMDVTVAGVVVLDNIACAGSGPDIFGFDVNAGDLVELDFVAGGWAYECAYYVYDETAALVVSSGDGGVEPDAHVEFIVAGGATQNPAQNLSVTELGYATWEAPSGPATSEWLQYDIDNMGFGGIGAEAVDYSLIWASKWVPADLTAYSPGYVLTVMVNQLDPVGDYVTEVRVLSGDGLTTLYAQDVTGTLVNGWNEIVLDSAVPFDNTENLWIAMYAERIGGTYNEPTSDVATVMLDRYDYFAYNGAPWTSINLEFGIDYQGWMLRGFVSTDPAGRGVALEHANLSKGNYANYSGSTPTGKGMIKVDANHEYEKFNDKILREFNTDTRDLLGYNVYLDGVFIEFVTELYYQYTGLVDGETYLSEVTALYDEGESDPISYTFTYLPVVTNPPQNLSVTELGLATWEAPIGPAISEWLQYDIDNLGFSGIGAVTADYSLIWASKWVPADLTPYTTGYVTKVLVNQYTDPTGVDYVTEVRILSGDGTNILYAQDVTGQLTAGWNEVILNDAVPFDNTENLWIAMYVERPVSCTANEPTSDVETVMLDRYDYFAYDGGPWTTINIEYGIDYQGWMLRGYVSTDPAGRSVALGHVDKKGYYTEYSGSHPTGNGMIKPDASYEHIRYEGNTATRDFLGYNVYLDGVFVEFVTELYYEYTGLVNGETYLSEVTALYDEGESTAIDYTFIYISDPVYDPPTAVAVDDYEGIVTWAAPAVGGVIIEDNFDSYTVGDHIAEVSSDWGTWTPGGAGGSEDGVISDAQALSPSNSLLIEGTNDQLLIMDDYTSGVYTMELDLYIPAGFCGYWNLQKTSTPGDEWGIQIMFDVTGEAVVDAGAAAAATFTFAFDTWIHQEVIVDLDSDLATYYTDGVEIIQYPWTLGTGGGSIPAFGGLNLYAWASTGNSPQCYFDNVVLSSGTTRDLTGYNVYLDDMGTILETVGADVFAFTYSDLVFDQDYVAGVSAIYDDGGESDIVEVPFTYTGLDAGNVIVAVTKLNGNYPNPFNPVTNIAYSIKEAGKVTLHVYNIKGQLVKTLVNDVRETGNYTVTWNGRDNTNKSVASGVYFYKMKAQNYNNTKKMILMK